MALSVSVRVVIRPRVGRRAFAGLRQKREAQADKLAALPELVQRAKLQQLLAQGACATPPARTPLASMAKGDVELLLDASLSTFLLHTESRIANHCGEGFYTIGPCGEELLSAVGLALREGDSVALHYRHLSTALARGLRSKSLQQVLLDRARGFTISTLDPVGGGHHCLLGGGDKDFLVTSTLASQSCPAVGRAAGLRLARQLRIDSPLPHDAVSYVSLGDGSVNNGHFLSAVNLAEYMNHRGFQCPVVFGISDNGLCISLKGRGWLDKFLEQRLGMPIFRADANDAGAVFKATQDAAAHARRRRAPAAVVFQGITRRFGHAATDRQEAYLTKEEIAEAENTQGLEFFCSQLVQEGYTTYPKLLERFNEIKVLVEESFDCASEEPKIGSREQVARFNSQPQVPIDVVAAEASQLVTKRSTQSKVVMRRNMTKVLDELLGARKNLVYIGEDVEHGGYYRVTEGLRAKYEWRVADFPPDETSLMGVAVGYSQAGLIPIVEIPYAKYLDCGGDMFFEAVIMNWLSAGKQPCGMVIRLQGFDKGVFGGNYHTHNSLHLPPGLDVVCYSNGHDYARGIRNAVAQAANGRVVMLVDSTDLLNRRHLFERDDGWMHQYPDVGDVMAFDEVKEYGNGQDLAIVTYGNGVPTALRAQRLMQESGLNATVIDSPYLSTVPQGLANALPRFEAVVFADVCKLGQHPHAGFIVQLQDQGLLPQRWRSVAATPTYNPLGSTVTFLNEDDILKAGIAVTR